MGPRLDGIGRGQDWFPGGNFPTQGTQGLTLPFLKEALPGVGPWGRAQGVRSGINLTLVAGFLLGGATGGSDSKGTAPLRGEPGPKGRLDSNQLFLAGPLRAQRPRFLTTNPWGRKPAKARGPQGILSFPFKFLGFFGAFLQTPLRVRSAKSSKVILAQKGTVGPLGGKGDSPMGLGPGGPRADKGSLGPHLAGRDRRGTTQPTGVGGGRRFWTQEIFAQRGSFLCPV